MLSLKPIEPSRFQDGPSNIPVVFQVFVALVIYMYKMILDCFHCLLFRHNVTNII
jgi:hypothetical protein